MNIDLYKNFEVESLVSNELINAMSEIQQPRSKFQIESFVVGQHATKEMQYYQTLLEIQSLYYTVRTVALQVKQQKIKIERLLETGDEIDAIEAEIQELGLEQTRMVAIGALRELEVLVEIWNSFPDKFTRDQIENNQPEYWEKRLMRQAETQALGQRKVNPAQIEAMMQSGLFDNQINLNNEEFKKALE